MSEFDYLDPDELQDIRDAFARFDKDGSGDIDATEFQELAFACGRNCVLSLGTVLTTDAVAEVLAQIDTSKDGRIQFDEFVRWWVTKPDFNQETQDVFVLRGLLLARAGLRQSRELYNSIELPKEDHKVLRAFRGLSEKDGPDVSVSFGLQAGEVSPVNFSSIAIGTEGGGAESENLVAEFRLKCRPGVDVFAVGAFGQSLKELIKSKVPLPPPIADSLEVGGNADFISFKITIPPQNDNDWQGFEVAREFLKAIRSLVFELRVSPAFTTNAGGAAPAIGLGIDVTLPAAAAQSAKDLTSHPKATQFLGILNALREVNVTLHFASVAEVFGPQLGSLMKPVEMMGWAGLIGTFAPIALSSIPPELKQVLDQCKEYLMGPDSIRINFGGGIAVVISFTNLDLFQLLP